MTRAEHLPAGRLHALATAAALVAVDWTVVEAGWRLPLGGPYALRVLAALAVVAFARRGDLGLALGPWRRDLAHTWRVAAACAAVGLVLLVGTVLWVRATGAEVPLEPGNFDSLDRFGPWLIVACVQAPIFEELIYRAWIQRELRDALGSGGAVFLSGILFWIYHWWMWGGVTPVNHLIGGWILAWSFERTRSLTTPVLLHALGNLVLGVGDAALLAWPERIAALLGG